MKNINSLLFTFCFFISISSIIGQSENLNPVVDSLLHRLELKQSDQDRLETLSKLLNEHASDTKIAEYYARKILKVSADINNKHVITAMTYIAKCQQYREEIDSSMTTLKYVLENSRNNGNFYGEYRALQLLGNGADVSGNIKDAENYFQQGLAMKDKAPSDHDKNNIAIIFGNNLGNILADRGDVSESIVYFEMAAAAAERSGNVSSQGVILNNIGSLYLEKKNVRRAIECFEKSRELRKSIGNKFGELFPTLNLMDIYLNKNSVDTLLLEVERGMKIANELNNPYFNDFILTYAVKAHVASGNLNRAKQYLDIIQPKLNSQKTAVDLKIAIYQAASFYFIAVNNYSKAKLLIKEEEKLMIENDWDSNMDTFLSRKFRIYNTLGLNDEVSLIFTEFEDLMRANVDQKFEDVGKIEALYTNAENEKKVILLEKDKEILSAVSTRNKLAAIATLVFGLIAFSFYIFSRKKNSIISSKNDELQKLNNVKDQLFQIIGHDIRKPAIAFRNVSKNLNYLIDKGDADRLKQLGREIDYEGKNLYNLTDNLLHWALMQKDLLSINPVEINVREVVAENIELFRSVAGQKEITITNDVDLSLVLKVDLNSLNTIIRNLLDNALKYTDKGGFIIVEATQNGDLVDISIVDNGVGMSDDEMKEILNDQITKSANGTDNEKGSGLGMRIIKSMLDLNNGRLFIDSNKGNGSTITISLPMVS